MDHGDESTIVATMWAWHSSDTCIIVLNMRNMNGKTKDEVLFDPFFEEMRRQLKSYNLVHSRRRSGKFPRSPTNIKKSMNTFLSK